MTRGRVVDAQQVGGFRRLVLDADLPVFAAGAKVQILLPSNDARTYTPIPSPTGMTLLGWTGAGGPGARWMSQVEVGADVRFLGPRRSLEPAAGPVVLVGDETSVAVAAALKVERPERVHAVLQCQAGPSLREAAAAVGLTRPDTVPSGDTAATAEFVKRALAKTPNATVVLTGGSELVIAVRQALRAAGIPKIETKPYWVPGKTGLD